MRRKQYWLTLLISMVLAQLAVSLFMPQGQALTVASDLIQGTLLFAATAAFVLRTIRERSNNLNVCLFWILMTTGMVFWLAYQAMWNYFEVIKGQEVPNPFVGDIVLFLHLVPMIAALGVLPHLQDEEHGQQVRMLDFTFLLTWWIFAYVYMVIPWQTVAVDEARYSSNLNSAYLTEKIVLLVALAALARTAEGGWRQLYGQLLGASALYASSSYVANWAIEHKTYYSGCIYDVPWIVSVAWLAAVPLFVTGHDLAELRPSNTRISVWITRLSVVALFSLPWVALHAEADATMPAPVRTFRVTVTLVSMVVMGVMAFWRQRLLSADLAYFLDKSNRSFDDLKAVQDQLIQSEKMASLGQLVGGAAHEINNPLTAMLGYSDLLSVSNLPDEEKRLASNIGEQVRRTKTLVSSLLTFARQAPAKLGLVDVNSIVQTSIRLIAPQLEPKGIIVRIDLGASLPLVPADSNQLLHVFLHLGGQVGSQIGGDTFAALFVRTHREGKTIVVDFLADAPFSRMPTFETAMSSEGKHKPSTLSLSACCRIIEDHGGRLLRPADLNVPAFRVELPVAAKAAGGQVSRAAARGAP